MAVRILRDNRASIRQQIHAAVQASVRESAELAEARAKVLVPVDTGALLASISAKPTGALRFSVASDKDYAKYVELGTSRQDAQPFLVPSLLSVQGMLPSIFRRNLKGVR